MAPPGADRPRRYDRLSTRSPVVIAIRLQGRLGRYARRLPERCVRILTHAGRILGLGSRHEISVLLTDGPTIRKFNARWRSISQSTNVLSFPLLELKAEASPPPGPLGDIVVALPVVRREARQAGMSLESHLAHMLVHGLLHLLGYDHQTPGEARRMERLESRLLSGIAT